MPEINPHIEESWKEVLNEEFCSTYFFQLKEFLLKEKKEYTVYPPGSLIFNAFNQTPFHMVKVVILGQDPYHGKGQAHGLSFSVPEGITLPPSLRNIFREIEEDTGFTMPEKGNLQNWARQGVLLLNATLTVRANHAGSHQNRGWEKFTDAAISKLSELRGHLVFLLWGNFAQAKSTIIDESRHLVLKAPHPSPFSANRGYFGCRHFSVTNQYLQNNGQSPIEWHKI